MKNWSFQSANINSHSFRVRGLSGNNPATGASVLCVTWPGTVRTALYAQGETGRTTTGADAPAGRGRGASSPWCECPVFMGDFLASPSRRGVSSAPHLCRLWSPLAALPPLRPSSAMRRCGAAGVTAVVPAPLTCAESGRRPSPVQEQQRALVFTCWGFKQRSEGAGAAPEPRAPPGSIVGVSPSKAPC